MPLPPFDSLLEEKKKKSALTFFGLPYKTSLQIAVV